MNFISLENVVFSYTDDENVKSVKNAVDGKIEKVMVKHNKTN